MGQSPIFCKKHPTYLTETTKNANGNMIKDLDRDILTIRYNLLNLPDTIQFKNGNQIINQYDAAGRKLSTRYYTILIPEYVPLINTLTPGKTIKLAYNMDIIDETGTFYVDNVEYKFNGCDPRTDLQLLPSGSFRQQP